MPRYADSEMRANGFGIVDAKEFFPELEDEEVLLSGSRFSDHGRGFYRDRFVPVEEIPHPKSPPKGSNLF